MSDQQIIVEGGRKIQGTAQISGSKNVVSKMIIASLLTSEQCIIENVPIISDIEPTLELCTKVGSKMEINKKLHLYKIKTAKINSSFVPELSRKNRISILAIGPLLYRTGQAEVPVLGGCPIGHRPVNLHIEALNKLGARIERRENSYYAEVKQLQGAHIDLSYPSVGATENILLSSVCAKGTTRVNNIAIEPEVLSLIDMLRKMGAHIKCNPKKRRLEVKGVKYLKGVKVCVPPDRNEMVSFACAALATGGEIFIPEANTQLIGQFIQKVKKLGVKVVLDKKGVLFSGKPPFLPVNIQTAPHPSFMTDWQQPFCVLLTQAKGTSIIHETVYEDRFGYTKELNRMGAKITVSDECLGFKPCRFYEQTFLHSASVTGPTPLLGTVLNIPDLRAGMAHLIAALLAQGKSTLTGVEHLDRGYEAIEKRLRALGAKIKRVESN